MSFDDHAHFYKREPNCAELTIDARIGSRWTTRSGPLSLPFDDPLVADTLSNLAGAPESAEDIDLVWINVFPSTKQVESAGHAKLFIGLRNEALAILAEEPGHTCSD